MRRMFEGWFGPGLVAHSCRENTGGAPRRDAAFERRTSQAPVCVYGHFTRHCGFGSKDNCPDATQVAALLRDPFDMMIAEYDVPQHVSQGRKDRSRVPDVPRAGHLMTARANMLPHVPRAMTADMHRDILDRVFLHIGFAADLPGSLSRLAACVGQTFDPETLPHVNHTARDARNTGVQPLRAALRARQPLEHAVYDDALTRFGPTGTTTGPHDKEL